MFPKKKREEFNSSSSFFFIFRRCVRSLGILTYENFRIAKLHPLYQRISELKKHPLESEKKEEIKMLYATLGLYVIENHRKDKEAKKVRREIYYFCSRLIGLNKIANKHSSCRLKKIREFSLESDLERLDSPVA